MEPNREEGVGCYLWTGFSRWLQDRRLVGAGVGSKSILQEARRENVKGVGAEGGRG